MPGLRPRKTNKSKQLLLNSHDILCLNLDDHVSSYIFRLLENNKSEKGSFQIRKQAMTRCATAIP